MPIYRRLPKRGFSNYPFRTEYAEINLSTIATKFDGEDVTKEALIAKGILKGIRKSQPVKILAKGGEFSKKVNFNGIEKFSKSARELIEKAGGTITEPPKKDKPAKTKRLKK
jgi:large subunit ribosomal protein L15